MEVIGVCGAGSMGAGIAQLAAQSGARTLIHDPVEGATANGVDAIRKRWARDVEKGRKTQDEVNELASRLCAADDLAAFAGAGLVIEAAPEQLELKRALFGELEGIVAADAILATNTSSLLVSAMANGLERPERVVGMHFFNPPPLMQLLEVVAGARTSDEAVAAATRVGEAMGKTVIVAADGPGFIVNRCNRPFNLEGLRLLQEGVATVEQIDRVYRLGGGFRMGPFELMDLTGLDVSFAVQESFYEQSYGEPRWRPSLLAAKQVAAGRYGRKTGEGWYVHPHEADDPPVPEGAEPPEDNLIVVSGDGALAAEIIQAAQEVGWDVALPEEAAGEIPHLIVDCGEGEEPVPLQGGPQVVLVDQAPLAAIDPGGTAAGFYALPPFAASGLVELTRQPTTSRQAAERAEHFFASLGKRAEWVGDAPGLVLGRAVCQLVNEACFAAGDRVGSPEDIDTGMTLGLNHPRGPLEWGDEIGPAEVLAVIEGLHAEYGEERYRPAPRLLRAVRSGTSLRG